MQHRVFHDTGLPGIVGAIEGTHTHAIPKPGDAQYSYINRKVFASINMGAIVDDNYSFLWFSSRWPGRAHDSRVWQESQLYQKFVRKELKRRIVGDRHRTEPFLITIVNSRDPTRSQAAYNKALCCFGAHVEQAFGYLKRQFHALQAGLRYRPQRTSRLIATAICLRNAAITFRGPDPHDDEGSSSVLVAVLFAVNLNDISMPDFCEQYARLIKAVWSSRRRFFTAPPGVVAKSSNCMGLCDICSLTTLQLTANLF
ncbi:hypothetical protein Aduo_019031 [Ancylostoma duodenale]